MKNVFIVTYDEQDSLLYAQQIQDLFYGLVSVEAIYTNNQERTPWPEADLYLIGNSALESERDISRFIPLGAEYVIINSTFTKKAISRLQKIPEGTRALFVSCNRILCNEAITRLQALGVNHISLLPYYPGAEYNGELEYAVTPGESSYLPETIRYMIDIGCRFLDADTIMETAIKLNLDHLLGEQKLKDYFSKLADNTYSYDKLFERSLRNENRLDILLDILTVGIIGVDENGLIFAYNEEAGRVLGISRRQLIGKDRLRLLDFIPFDKYRGQNVGGEPELIRYHGTLLNVTINPIVVNGCNRGMFATIQRFQEIENKQNKLRSQLNDNNQRARYTFDDIICKSRLMEQACFIARKMAKTNSSILITGESGTGKELFAHAIHNASPRKNAPFVAINCAALPETLLESELFGYEEGAFTGAKKGGKIGLFEFAHSGTLFLDEVEGMSPALQIKLLRALQEKEIMRLGGNTVIHVDVRIIATSNERLDELVNAGRFRSDLYYRLNTLPIYLAPLRDRREDIDGCIEAFLKKSEQPLVLSEAVRRIFAAYPWKGNVRELKNTLEYLSFLEKPFIEPEDLPPSFSHYLQQETGPVPQVRQETTEIPEPFPEKYPHVTQQAYLFLLHKLAEARQHNVPMGRAGLQALAAQAGLPLSQENIRFMLGKLSERGLVTVSVGRNGSRITDEGLHYLTS